MEIDTFVGPDVGKANTAATAVDLLGHRVRQAKLGASDGELIAFLDALPGRKQVALVACHVWEHINDAAASNESKVLLAHPFETKLITKATLKTDKVDSEKLALLARLDAVLQAFASPSDLVHCVACAGSGSSTRRSPTT